MFTEVLTKRSRRFALLDLLTGPHGVDRYTELVDPTWTRGNARAKVVGVRRSTPRSVTLTLAPNRAFDGFRAGQHINVSVEIDGRRRTRPYSPANAEGEANIELTIGRHDGGLVSTYLFDHARRGMVVGLDSVGGDFVLPARPAENILFVSGGSGITPVMSMLRTLRARRHAGQVTFVHYARSADEACYRAELAVIAREMPNVTVLHGYTRVATDSDLDGRFGAGQLPAGVTHADAVYACGPPALVDAVRELHPHAESESFVPPVFTADESGGGTVSFTTAGVDVVDDGRPLLNQAEDAGLAPESGCRMGICFSCTRRKTSGVVRNVVTGAVSSTEEEDVQICVSAAVGDVDIDL
ncbi:MULTISPECIES: ferredoxin reductase [Mycolicibacterium]|uniref:Flavodoxin reductase family protein n=3 Tax=Mycolicibacterium gilvum TaxID=1804 RepID=E6TBS4_MYCSR|nr:MULTISPECIES: ferredoxin reductase [Mycolicibacterium]ABP47283.1 Oxidoreductase FAD-binding domain protein [Mycolicibacterium gilvum PYR-GCK]ADU00786.1 flavodoxin reductase family protein [Mycolicibacterium gilvum Spyr1]MBV5242340.1 ferredoxin reductase [Mycolicibacterium sp. PAM1]MCV7055392.1 ferredoxin reductase [Mycolicibacterium gilvum]STZ42195.1 oxidoreductase FAD-binding subunit [Mycolicibacterium gilvum]